jgi:hypothetical protein
MPHKSPKGFTAVEALIIILVVAALAFGGWYVWNKNNEDSTSNSSSQTTKTEDQSMMNIPEGWKQYKNEDYGFSFYYPEKVGPLMEGDTGGNPDILTYVKSVDNENAFANYTQSPLYVRVDKKEGFTTSAAKYGPVLEFKNGKWIVSSEDGGDINNGGYDIGSEYKAQTVKTGEGNLVYNFSYTDEGCHRTVWVFQQEQAFVTITLPAVCADEIDTIPQERLDDYQKVSDQMLETLSF